MMDLIIMDLSTVLFKAFRKLLPDYYLVSHLLTKRESNLSRRKDKTILSRVIISPNNPEIFI